MALNTTPNNYDITLEMIYHPTLIKIKLYYSYTIFTIATIGLPLIIYVILTQSTKAMGNYKYLLANIFIWSYLFDFLLVLWQPVIIFPLPGAYSAGKIDQFSTKKTFLGVLKTFGSSGFYTIFTILMILIVGMAVSIIAAFIYRFLWIFESCFCQVVAESRKSLVFYYSLFWFPITFIFIGKC